METIQEEKFNFVCIGCHKTYAGLADSDGECRLCEVQ